MNPIIRDLAPMVRELDYHMLLGGGVLNTGASTKDLDLWFMPLNGYESNPLIIVDLLISMLGSPTPIRDSPDYHPDDMWHLQEALRFTLEGRRIDCFIQ